MNLFPKIRALTVSMFLFMTLPAFAAEVINNAVPDVFPPTISLLNRIICGGNFGMIFEDGGTNIMIQPFIGFRITNDFSTGLNFYYEYEDYNYISNAYGIGPFVRYEAALAGIFGWVIHGEYDYGWSHIRYKGSNERQINTIDRMPLGAGLYIQTTTRGRLSLVALWDVLNFDKYDRSGAPTIRVGYTF